MISHVALATIWVTDQDLAKDFYISKLGFVEESDITMDDGNRWLTVMHPAQPRWPDRRSAQFAADP